MTIKLWIFELIYNQFHNILRLFDVLPNFRFTTSETMHDYYLSTLYIQVVSRVAEPLKTKEIRKYQEIVYTPQNDSPAPSAPTKIEALPILAENPRKTEIKPFLLCATPHEN